MAINKNFVIKNGAEINTKLIVADAATQKVGIGTTIPTYTLHVFGPNEQPGSIGATVLNVTGVTTTTLLNVGAAATFSNGPVLVGTGTSTGTSLQTIQVGSSTTERGVYISGDTGIGITLPGARLNVVPTSTQIAGLFSGTTSSDLVRLTQLGSGNALVVEDDVNPDATAFVISGLGSVGIGTNVPRYLLDIDGTKFASEGLAVGQTAVYIRGDVKIIGDLSADDFTFDQAVHVYLNTSGFGTITSLLVPNTASISVGIITNIQGGNLTLAGITTGVNAPGITTIGFLQNTNISVTGFSTLSGVSASELRVTGFSTFGGASASELRVTGFSTLGGSSATLLNVSGLATVSGGMVAGQGVDATRLRVTGVTTITGGVNANEGADLARLRVTGITTLGQANITGLSNAGVSTLSDANASTLVVTGFSTLGGSSATLLTVSGLATVSGGLLASQGVDAARLRVTGITTLGQVNVTGLSNAGVSTLGDARASTLVVTGFSTLGGVSGSTLNVSGISSIANLLITPSASGIGATVGSAAGIITYYGDGANLTGVSVGIRSAGNLIGYGVTTLNFIGIGNTFLYNPATRTVDISIRSGTTVGFNTYNAGIATASSVGVNTSNLDDPGLTGIGNSFQGLYIGNGMLIVDNALNGNHYIGTDHNGLMAGPVTINGTLTIDGNWVVV
jgi:hypothetical protein